MQESISQIITYYFYDLVTNVKLAELSLINVKFGSVLNGVGSFQAAINMADSQIKKQLSELGGGDPSSAIQTSRTAIYIDINGVLMWGGILWTSDYDNYSYQSKLNGAEFWSYFNDHALIDWDADYSGGADMFFVVQDLINTWQAKPGGNIGVIVPSNLSGVTVSPKWDPTQLTTIGRAVSSMSKQNGNYGFDYAIDVAYDTFGVPRKYLTLSYPRRGRIAGATGLVFDNGSQWAGTYRWPIDGTSAANYMYGIGAGSGPATAASPGGLRTAQAYPEAIDVGYPLLMGTMNRSDVTDIDLLNKLTISKLAANATPSPSPQMKFDLACPDPQFGSYLMGDDGEIRIQPDEWHTDGIGIQPGTTEYWRVVQWQVDVGEDGVSPVTIAFQQPPLYL